MSNSESKTAWIVAGVLLMLLIVVGYLYLTSQKDLNTVLENGKANISAARDQIKKDCQGPDMDADECKADKADLASILADFSTDIQAASTSVTASGTASTTR